MREDYDKMWVKLREIFSRCCDIDRKVETELVWVHDEKGCDVVVLAVKIAGGCLVAAGIERARRTKV